ncbi:uncharacterized protein M6B38_273780 [Iris pallida]|uniref:Uncharacterized protein n=1 Tax=Iris pallida TaxID=29817 RepID=A0AAX6I5S4_IRIPA|nr:uncharacterized protein M6B38_273780 [Iris pallida]
MEEEKSKTDPSAPAQPEEAIVALLEHLVLPLLPLRDSDGGDPPSVRQQEAVAKQMHAAVILYNYYHRKQFPSLEFLNFESFCKIASTAKPGLLKYMKFMNRCEEDLEVLNNLSITEKIVMEACHVCAALDASKAFPDIEGWPISKVAVLLVDSTKENCLLHFSSITQGVWSLVEKVHEISLEKLMVERKIKRYASNKKRTLDGSSARAYKIEEELEQLAFSAVEQETGINLSDLSILERHVTYSLSHEKESAQFYIMKYERVVSEELAEVPIVDVISSLEGPIVERGVAPIITPVVEYFHVLPYIEIISNWLQREATSHGSLCVSQREVVDENCSLVSNRIHAMKDSELSKKTDLKEQKLNFQKKKMVKSEHETTKLSANGLPSSDEFSAICSTWVELDKLIPLKYQGANDQSLQKGKNEDIFYKNKVKEVATSKKVSGPMSGSPGAVYPRKIVVEKQSVERDRMLVMEDGAIKRKSDLNEKTGFTRSRKMSKNETEIVKNTNNPFPTNGLSRAVSISQDTSGSSGMEPVRLTSTKHQTINESSIQNGQTQDTVFSKDVAKDTKKFVGPCMLQSSGNLADSSCMEPDRLTTKDKIVDDKSWQSRQTQENLITSNRNVISGEAVAADGSKEFDFDNYATFYRVMESKRSDILQASLRVLLKKRDELCLQQRLIADEIAQCEMNIQTINEAEENMSSNVEPIIEALNIFCSSEVQLDARLSLEERCGLRAIKRRKLSEAVFSTMNPCKARTG